MGKFILTKKLKLVFDLTVTVFSQEWNLIRLYSHALNELLVLDHPLDDQLEKGLKVNLY